jgi:cytochrome b6-f complex iron-sulfur subunit
MTDQDRASKGRRTFLTRIGLGGVAAMSFASIGATVRYLFPAVLYEPSLKTKVGLPSEFVEGTATFLPESKIFVHKGSTGVYAISATCTHLGCVVSAQEDGYTCPCHGSVFNEQGAVVAGPAPRGLPWFEVSVAPSGQLVVDRSRPVAPGTKLVV